MLCMHIENPEIQQKQLLLLVRVEYHKIHLHYIPTHASPPCNDTIHTAIYFKPCHDILS